VPPRVFQIIHLSRVQISDYCPREALVSPRLTDVLVAVMSFDLLLLLFPLRPLARLELRALLGDLQQQLLEIKVRVRGISDDCSDR
jgi:hypothetical protein